MSSREKFSGNVSKPSVANSSSSSSTSANESSAFSAGFDSISSISLRSRSLTVCPCSLAFSVKRSINSGSSSLVALLVAPQGFYFAKQLYYYRRTILRPIIVSRNTLIRSYRKGVLKTKRQILNDR
jgi:hypothetical protein